MRSSENAKTIPLRCHVSDASREASLHAIIATQVGGITTLSQQWLQLVGPSALPPVYMLPFPRVTRDGENSNMNSTVWI